MPLEGHWERTSTPLRETTLRERRLLLAVSLLLGVAVVAAVFVAIASSSPATPAGCIRIEAASTMGSGTTQICGDAAVAFCRGSAAHSAALEQAALPKCRDAGY
jgi:hypothetical protein